MSKPTQGNVILDPMGNEYRFTSTSDKPVTISFGGSSHPVEVHVIPAAAPAINPLKALASNGGADLIGWDRGRVNTRLHDDEAQAVFETWLNRECPSGDVDSVQCQWLESDDYADMMDAREAVKSPVMPSDEPGIQSAKYEAKQEAPTIINGVQVDPVALAAFLASQQPAPIPNTTPRGILTVFNERADHRLGMWQGMME